MTPQQKLIFDRVNMLSARIFNDPSHPMVSKFREVMTEFFLQHEKPDVPFTPPPAEVVPLPQPEDPKPRPVGRPKLSLDPDTAA